MKNIFLVWLILFCFIPQSTKADSIDFPVQPNENPVGFDLQIDKNSFLNPDFFEFNVSLQTAKKSANAFSFLFEYDAKKISLQETKIDKKICEFKILEKNEKDKGYFVLLCANSQPMPNNQLLQMKFKKLSPGKTKYSLAAESAVYLADGQGTRIPVLPESGQVIF